MKQLSVLLAGAGGYGNVYLKALLDEKKDDHFVISAIVDPKPQNSHYYQRIKDLGIPIYSTMEAFYEEGRADLAIIVSPIQYHCSQTCLALSQGSHVLCEKPASAVIQEIDRMIEARDRASRMVAIGYQWSFSDTIQELKKDIQKGFLGKPKRLKSLVLWPRRQSYFQRNNWAGKKMDDKGNWILDSVVNNATAHYLHNMFYVLGKEIDRSARPEWVVAELYRANDIENFDTAAVRVQTEEGVELLFIASHAVDIERGPAFCYEFEKATVVYERAQKNERSEVIAVFKDGTQKSYGDPFRKEAGKLWRTMNAIRGNEITPCGLEAASSHTLCVNGMQESVKDIPSFPEELIRVDETDPKDPLVFMENLVQLLTDCYESWKMPHEAGILWAKAGQRVELRGYKEFNG
ncbi:MAG: Gfo/Idh/MocA family protein [Clostridia bacterium]|jgi:predicted dehydrogenase